MQGILRVDMKALSAAKLAGIALSLCAAAPAQTVVADEDVPAVQHRFESAAGAGRLRCDMSPVRPQLDYSLRFQTGYRIDFPLRQITGSGHVLSMFLRVTPAGGKAVYLEKSGNLVDVPDAKLTGEVSGEFVVGEGAYTVEALLEDDAGRACSSKWRIQAKRTGAERDVAAANPAGAVLDDSPPLATIASQSTQSIDRLTILLDAAPRFPRAAKLEPATVLTMVDSLAALVQHLPARHVRLVVFNLDQQSVLLRSDDFHLANFEKVENSLDGLQLATVDYKRLQNGQSSDLLINLVNQELHDPKPASAVIFLGPRTVASFDPALQRDLERTAATQWFYLQYRRMPRFPARPVGPGDMESSGMGRRPMAQAGITPPSGRPMQQAPDAIEELMRHFKQEVILVHSPTELAGAIRHMASEIPVSQAPAESAARTKTVVPPEMPERRAPISDTAPPQVESAENPVEVLIRLRDTVLEHAGRVPNHMCVETIRRERYNPPATLRKPSCAAIMDAAPGERKPSLRHESTDWLRLDVGLTTEEEIFSWAGANRFDDREIDELVPEGAIGTGAFASLLLAVFEGDEPHFRFEGDTNDGPRRVFEYSFSVPLEESHYRVRTRTRQWVFTGYSGKLLVDPHTSELVRLIVRTDELSSETSLCQVENDLTFSMVPLEGFDYLLPKTTRQFFFGRDGGQGENDTTFAGCREYRGESTIAFGETATTGDTPRKPGAPGAVFPAGLPVTIALAAPFRFEGGAAGDRIEGRLEKPILDARGQTVVAPGGAKVQGRIVRLALRYSTDPQYSVALRWETVEVDGRKLPLLLKPKRTLTDVTPAGRLRQRVEIELPLPGQENDTVIRLPQERSALNAGFRTEWITVEP